MSAINKSATLAERREWWVGCLGSCIICGTPLRFPAGEEKKSLVTRGPIETLLFKYGLSQTMQQAHLIDEYVLDNAKRISRIVIKDLNLKVTGMWETHDGDQLMQHIQQSRNFVMPTCHDCNVLMTKTVSDITTTFYGVLDPDWFRDGKIPYSFLDKVTTKMSNAKALQAIFVFFVLEHKEVHLPSFSERIRNKLTGLAQSARQRIDADAKGYLGKFVRKMFSSQWYYGKIIDINKEEGTGKRMLHVYYSDGDKEDFYLGDMRTHAVPRSNVSKEALVVLDKVQVQYIAPDTGAGAGAAGGSRQTGASSTGTESDGDGSGNNGPSGGDGGGGGGGGSGDGGGGAVDVGQGANTSAALPITVGSTSADEGSDGSRRPRRRGGGGQGEKHYHWTIKSKRQVFLDQCIVKTVSHLMQWGATKYGRHRAIAVFWSGYYLWLKFVDTQKNNMTEFRIWFTHTFRDYYMQMFPQNTWFTHDALTIAQLTNLNASVENNAGTRRDLAMPWIKWARDQLHAFEADMKSLTDFVYEGKTDTLRDPTLAQMLTRRDSVRDTLDNIREYTLMGCGFISCGTNFA